MSKPRLSRRDPERIAFAREQRVQANDFTRDVWQMLRDRRMLGQKFRREYPVGPYTLDFVCIDLKLSIEIDGKGHLSEEGKQHDQYRDAYLDTLGYVVLRIPGFHVTQDPLSVMNEIEAAVSIRLHKPYLPSPRFGERGRG